MAAGRSLADHVCLAVIAEGPTHGWAIVKELAPDGDLGRIWSLSRPLTYRSLDLLVADGLVTRRRVGRRHELRVTAAGRRAHQRWLTGPVAHLRELRTEFLVKTRLIERSGGSPADLARRQLDALGGTIRALTSTAAADPVERWRQEAARAAERFLESLAEDPGS